jgi:hypothetical protein
MEGWCQAESLDAKRKLRQPERTRSYNKLGATSKTAQEMHRHVHFLDQDQVRISAQERLQYLWRSLAEVKERFRFALVKERVLPQKFVTASQAQSRADPCEKRGECKKRLGADRSFWRKTCSLACGTIGVT